MKIFRKLFGQKRDLDTSPTVVDEGNVREPEPFNLHVEKYKGSDRLWALYLNGELVAVMAYKKGAERTKELLEELHQRILFTEARMGAMR